MVDLPLPEPIEPYEDLIVGSATALLIVIVGFIVSKWAASLTSSVLRKRNTDEALSRFLGSIAQYLVLAATLIAALEEVGVVTTSLIALLGSVGLAIGLALQGNLGHFASGVMILFFRPFTIGDVVTAGGHTGGVTEIGLFATTMTTPSNEKIIVPNGGVTGGSIVNHTVLGQRRGDIAIGVAYGSDMNQVMQVLIAACERCDLVLEDPAPSVALSGFGASSVDFSVRPWATSDDFLAMLHQVRMAVYEDLEKAGIDIPFDQVVMHQAS